mgnify:CR=1 FL=1
MSSSYIYRIYTTEDNYITLPSEIGYVRLRLRGHPLTKQNSADVYIVLKYKIDLEDHVINFNEIPESFQQDLLDEFLHIQGDEQENGDVLRFNLYEAYLPEHIIKDTFVILVNEEEEEGDEEEKVSSPYSVRWDNFALSFYNGEEYDGNITNAIKEIVVIRNQSGNRLGGRKRRRRKKSKRKKSKRKKSKRKKSTRRKSKKKRRKKKRK